MTKSPARQRAERTARIMLITMAAVIPLYAVLIVWLLGFDVHPHRIAFACIIAAAGAAWGVLVAWLHYRVTMKRISKTTQ